VPRNDDNRPGLCGLERGDFNPSLDLAFRISEFFQLPVEAIFSRKPFRPMSNALYPTGGE
jgi:DNA-binding XRE family transcriptional regulator